ncbi:MAG: SEC-C domain-containing protein, partial [Chloroflexi bacterium]|nr:SEC-C domain-containing protein [Chloroflexota bacterium]
GVDILLGGKDNPEAAEEAKKVRELGGLHIIGSERHESRRIDNQLRGRAGRQGDPGSSRYFVSLEDELWRLFGDRTKSYGMNLWDEWLPIDNKLVTFAIERTQKKVELYHFDIRKHTLQYDEVLNEQRTIIYKERRKILEGADLKSNIETYIREVINDEVDKYCSTEVHQEEWDFKGLWDSLNGFYPLLFHAPNPKHLESRSRSELHEFLTDAALKQYEEKEAELTPELLRQIERMYALDFLTNKWMEHLDAMDYLREGIGLRGYAQVDPVMAYRQEGENYFQQLVGSWKRDLISAIYHTAMQPQQPEPARMPQRQMRMVENISGEDGHDPITEMSRGAAPASEPAPRPLGGPRQAPAKRPADSTADRFSNNTSDRFSNNAADRFAQRPADGVPNSGSDGEAAAGPARVTPRIRADRAMDGVSAGEKIGRNDLCPCGSGKKYKKCHGVAAGAAAGQGD